MLVILQDKDDSIFAMIEVNRKIIRLARAKEPYKQEIAGFIESGISFPEESPLSKYNISSTASGYQKMEKICSFYYYKFNH